MWRQYGARACVVRYRISNTMSKVGAEVNIQSAPELERLRISTRRCGDTPMLLGQLLADRFI